MIRRYGVRALFSAIAEGVKIRPVSILRAFLARRNREESWQVYIAEQLWMINRATYGDAFNMARFHEMIEEDSEKSDTQKASDEKEKIKVHAWLMGGEGYGSIHAGSTIGT